MENGNCSLFYCCVPRAVRIYQEGLLWCLPGGSRQAWERRLGEVGEEKGGGGL